MGAVGMIALFFYTCELSIYSEICQQHESYMYFLDPAKYCSLQAVKNIEVPFGFLYGYNPRGNLCLQLEVLEEPGHLSTGRRHHKHTAASSWE